MKKEKSGFMWGIILILAGLFIAGRSFGFLTFSLFFRGWWTLFIIIPCFIGLFNGAKKDKSSNMVGLGIGILLLLSSNGIFPWGMVFPLGLAGFCIYMGLHFLKSGKDNTNQKTQYYTGDEWENQNYSGAQRDGYYSYGQGTEGTAGYDEAGAGYSDPYQGTDSSFGADAQAGAQGTESWRDTAYQENSSRESAYQNTGYNNTYGNNGRSGTFAGTAVLSGKTVRFDNELVTNGMFSAVLGGIDLDLRHAIIRDSVVIETKVLLGGIDILVPRDVRVVVNCVPILGGVDDKTVTPPGGGYLPTIYINGTCVLGGIDVKYK